MSSMNEQDIREGLESGRQHPHPLLMALHREGEDELARFVATEGPRYLSGTERLKFRSLVRELYPEMREAEDAEQRRRSQQRYEARSTAVGEKLQQMAAAKREQRLSRSQPSQGGGWNTPLDVPRS